MIEQTIRWLPWIWSRVQKGKELNDFQRNPLDIEISTFDLRGSAPSRLETLQLLFVTLVTEVSLISREPNLRFERISISRGFL